MYRIQAHNVKLGRIDVYRCESWEYPETMAKIKVNPDYGLIDIEWIARGFCAY